MSNPLFSYDYVLLIQSNLAFPFEVPVVPVHETALQCFINFVLTTASGNLLSEEFFWGFLCLMEGEAHDVIETRTFESQFQSTFVQ